MKNQKNLEATYLLRINRLTWYNFKKKLGKHVTLNDAIVQLIEKYTGGSEDE